MSVFPATILLATDGSEEAVRATELSRDTGSEVHAVCTCCRRPPN